MAALTARRAGLGTVLIDEASDGPRHCVGEVLAPAARRLLDHIGALRYLPSHCYIESCGTRSAWGTHALQATDFITGALGAGLHVDRHAFNRALARAVAAGGARILAPARLVAAGRETAGWRLVVRREARHETLAAAALVDCSGRRAIVARQEGATHRVDEALVAVIAWLDAPGDSDLDATLLVESAPDGWWYSTRLPGRRRVVGFVTNRRAFDPSALSVVGWRAKIDRNVHVSEVCRAHGYELRQAPSVVSASSARLDVVAGVDWVAAGDATATFDPLSGQGILTALVSGRLAARAIAARLAGDHGRGLDEYASGWKRVYDEYLSRRAASYALETRWPQSPFWLGRSRGERLEAHASVSR